MMTVEMLNAWGSGWSTFMARALIDSSVLLAAVALIWLPLRRRMSAQFAHGLFLLVLLKLAVPISASWPSWSAEAPLKWAASGVSAWATTDGNEVPTRPPADPVDDPIVVASSPEPIVAAASSPAPKPDPLPEPVRVAAPPIQVRTPLSTSSILMLGWAAISLALFARFFRSIWVTRRLIRESLPVPDGLGWFPVDFEALRRTAGVRSAVRWAVSAKVTSPAVGGLLRPTVVMPPDLDDGLTPKQLNWVLLHELAHIRRGDLWVVMVQRLVGAVFFFHPAVHLANWIIDQLREYACDDVALAAAHASRHACGEGFLTIVGRSVDHAYSPSPALGLFESRMLIHRRLLRILDSRRTVHERLSPLATVSLVAMALVVLPYGRARDAAATLSIATSTAPSVAHLRPIDEPRQFALGSTFLHDDRASSSGQPRSPVLAVAYSPDGRNLATSGEDKAIVIRDPATGAVRFRLEGHTDTVTCLAFSPDGSTLASGSYDTTVRLWDVATGRLREALNGHVQWIFALAFSPDGQALASSGSDRTIRLWDARSGRPISTLSGSTSAIRALAFSPDGQALASAGADRVVTLWTWPTLTRASTLAGHRGTIRALAFSPDGQSLATAGEDGEVKLWNPKTGRERASLTGHSDMVFALAFSPAGSTLASAGLDSCIKLWDAKTGRERATLAGHVDGIPALAFAPGARQLASTGYDGTVKLWEPAAPTLSAAATLDYPGEARDVAFAPDGKALHATGSASALATYDPIAGLRIENGLPGAGTRLAIAPDGKTMAIGGPDGRVRLIDLATRLEVATLEAHNGEVRALAFGRGGKILATGGIDGKVFLHEVGPRSKPRELPASGGPIADLRFTPGGEILAVAAEGRAGEIDLFDADSAEPRSSLPPRGADVASLAFSPDGRTIATVGLDGGVALFDVATRSKRTSWADPQGKAIAFSPDGRFLATGHKGGDVVLWEAATGVKLATLRGHDRAVSGVAFAPDGRTVASSGLDKTVRLWNLGARRITPRTSLNGDLACIGPVAISPDGKTLASAEVAYDSVGHIALWDLARRTSVKLHGHDRGVASLAFSPDGKTLASSSWDLTIRLWDARTGDPRGEFATTEAVARLAFSPDGKTLAAAGEDKVLTFWDVEAGSELGRIEGFRGPIYALAFSPDGRRIATGGGLDLRKDGFGEVKVFDVLSHEELADLAGHTAPVWSMAFSSDGSTLVTGGVDSTVRIWDVESGKPRLALGGFPDHVRALGLSPDGRSLAVAGRGDGVVSLLDASSGGEIARLVGHGGLVLGLSFSPDGRTLATGSLDASVKLWDVPANRAGIASR